MSTHDTALVAYQFSIDSAVAEWLAQKKTTGSARTAREYERTMQSFRLFLAAASLDVLPITAQTQEEVTRHAIDIARAAGMWAGIRAPARLKKDGTVSVRFDQAAPVSANMYNQRLACLSSFYAFVRETYKLDIPNPVTPHEVKRRPVQMYADAAAQTIPPEDVESGLDGIDRSTPEGLRDYALLAVALYTGRRASELAGMRGADVKIRGRGQNTQLLLTFRAKGAKKKHDLLDPETSAVLLDYLHLRFGKHLQAIPDDAPIWISYSRNATRGQAISIRTLSNIMLDRLGTSKVHATRHTFTVGMLRSGAPITDVSERLGHSSILVTQRYAKELTGDENKYGAALVKRFGIKRKQARR